MSKSKSKNTDGTPYFETGYSHGIAMFNRNNKDQTKPVDHRGTLMAQAEAERSKHIDAIDKQRTALITEYKLAKQFGNEKRANECDEGVRKLDIAEMQIKEYSIEFARGLIEDKEWVAEKYKMKMIDTRNEAINFSSHLVVTPDDKLIGGRAGAPNGFRFNQHLPTILTNGPSAEPAMSDSRDYVQRYHGVQLGEAGDTLPPVVQFSGGLTATPIPASRSRSSSPALPIDPCRDYQTASNRPPTPEPFRGNDKWRPYHKI